MNEPLIFTHHCKFCGEDSEIVALDGLEDTMVECPECHRKGVYGGSDLEASERN